MAEAQRTDPSDEVRARALAGKNVRVRPLASAAGVSPGAIYQGIKAGNVEAVSLGRAKLVTAPAARRLLGIEAA
jgi:hypothetical protein